MIQSSIDEAEAVKSITNTPNGLRLSFSQRLLMLSCHYFPFLHSLSVILVIAIPWSSWSNRAFAGITLLFLIPPLAARTLKALFPIPEGRIKIGTQPFFVWWALANLQMVFCRLTILEEIIRLVPGLYTLWLRLWGARIGRFTYWGAGLRILDRSFLEIGDDVVFGAGVRLTAHVLAKNSLNEMELILATIHIGDRVVVGGYSLLTAGTEILPDECTRALLVSPPFSKWKGGVRISKGDEKP